MEELFGETKVCRKSLSKLEIEEENRVLYVLSSYDGSSIYVTVCDETKNWIGELNASQLAHLAKQVKMTTSEYVTETLKALTRENLGLATFIYQVKNVTSNDIELVWKKGLSDNIRFQLGSLVLHEQKSKLHSDLFDYAIETISNLQQEIAAISANKAKLVNERQAALNRLEKCANIKEEVEKDLYSKFKLVLNDKKGKIRRLMDQLAHANNHLQTVEETPAHKSDNETDDEIATSSSPPTEGCLLGDHFHSSPPPVKRRKRESGFKAKGQPLEIPRPPSINRGRSSENQKMRSVSSSSDLKQEDSLESDDLLGLL